MQSRVAAAENKVGRAERAANGAERQLLRVQGEVDATQARAAHPQL